MRKSAKFWAIIFLTLAVVLIFTSAGPFWYHSSADKQVYNDQVVNKQSFSANNLDYPAKLYIPRISKVLNISDGEVINNRWKIAKTGVSYLVTSALPGSAGNSVIYGHNLPDVLGRLTLVRDGDFVYVIDKNGQYIKYEIFETKQINPDQVEILNDTEDSRLTIYTCSGFLDQARFVVSAKQLL